MVWLVPKLNIIIPARREYPHLVWTIYSYVADMPQDWKWHIHVITNDADDNQKAMDEWLRQGKLAKLNYLTVESFNAPMHPYACIQHATEQLDDGLLIYSCGHIAIQRGTIEKMVALAQQPNVGIVHSPQLHIPDHPDMGKLYHYKDPVKRGWTWQRVSNQPYKACSGSGALSCLKLSDWNEIGGCDVPFGQGIGGCETLVDMKMWMFNKSVWIHPECLYWHWTKTRGFTWTMGQHEWNQLVAYYCLGGREFMEQMNQGFSYPQKTEILDQVQSACSEHRRFIIDHATFTLDEVLETKPWLNQNEQTLGN